MQEIYVNGKKIICNGRNITITNGRVIVDGKEIHNTENDIIGSPVYLEVIINGDVGSISCDGAVKVQGNAGMINCGGSCSVGGDVSGNVRAGGSVQCGNVKGSVKAGGSINMR